MQVFAEAGWRSLHRHRDARYADVKNPEAIARQNEASVRGG